LGPRANSGTKAKGANFVSDAAAAPTPLPAGEVMRSRHATTSKATKESLLFELRA
jgi:hypothetical protein